MNPASMRITIVFLMTSTITLLAFAAEPVVDTRGNKISPGKRFYIKSTPSRVAIGGVRYAKTENSNCPVTVLQDFSGKGMAVTMKGISTDTDTVFADMPVEISFEDKPDCAESSKWVLVDDALHFVGIGGAKDHPGKTIVDGSFRIRGTDLGDYKFVFCPESAAGLGVCHDVGRILDDHGQGFVLILDGDSFIVMFDDHANNGSSVS